MSRVPRRIGLSRTIAGLTFSVSLALLLTAVATFLRPGGGTTALATGPVTSGSYTYHCDADGDVVGMFAFSPSPASASFSVFLTYHVPGSGDWIAVPGGSESFAAGSTSSVSFTLDASAVPGNANSIRIENGMTNEKSNSFLCADLPSATVTSPAKTETPGATSTSAANSTSTTSGFSFHCDENGDVIGTFGFSPSPSTIAFQIFLTYHVPGGGEFFLVPGGDQSYPAGTTSPASFTLDASQLPADANTMRIENSLNNEKSDSFLCEEKNAPTATATSPATSTPTPAATNTATATETVAAATNTPTATETVAAATNTPTATETVAAATNTATAAASTNTPSATATTGGGGGVNTATPTFTATSEAATSSATPTATSTAGGGAAPNVTTPVSTPTRANAVLGAAVGPSRGPAGLPNTGEGSGSTSRTLFGVVAGSLGACAIVLLGAGIALREARRRGA